MFLLDTNVHSELRRGPRADEHVLRWAREQRLLDFYLSAITLMELQIGALRLARRDVEQAAMFQRWIDKTVQDFEGRVIAIDLMVAFRCATLHVPNPRSDRDALIAATALVSDLTVVTRNTRHFEGTGVRLLNPWISA
jgi:predicted nucleic acid-binding protein